MRKEEARVLVFDIGIYYSVFATYRKEFIEELYIMRNPLVRVDLVLKNNLKTIEEVSYVLSCSSKYTVLSTIPGFKVVEGGEELVLREKYCRLISLLICMLDRRGYMPASLVEDIYEVGSKCVLGGEFD
ncbi:MAG: hypothetical protein QXE81_02250 [Desulfurococcaceae archaeon]